MKAKEMFEELGYPLYPRCVFYDQIMYGEVLSGIIIFDLTFKHVICNVTITPEIHKAIHQQMKELGWLDE